MSISASIAERRRAVIEVGKTGWTLKSVGEKLPLGGSDIAAINELMAEARETRGESRLRRSTTID